MEQTKNRRISAPVHLYPSLRDFSFHIPQVTPVGRAGPEEHLPLDKPVVRIVQRLNLRHFLFGQRILGDAFEVIDIMRLVD